MGWGIGVALSVCTCVDVWSLLGVFRSGVAFDYCDGYICIFVTTTYMSIYVFLLLCAPLTPRPMRVLAALSVPLVL